MKNLFFTVGTLFIFGIFILGYSSQANAMTEETNDLEEIDPIVAQDGDEDGINDQSSVNIQIKKVSDNLIVPFGAGQWDYIGKSSFKFNVRSFVDGDNKKAELRLQKLTMPTTTVDTEWWD